MKDKNDDLTNDFIKEWYVLKSATDAGVHLPFWEKINNKLSLKI